MSEFTKESPAPSAFDDVVGLVSQLMEPDMIGSSDEYGQEIEIPGWDGTIRRLNLEPEVASQAGLGDSVRARVIGDYETGMAFVLRSRNLFKTGRYGLYVQRGQDGNSSEFEVWQAPASKPKHGEIYWGIELLDRQQASQCSPLVAQGFIKSLQQNLQ